MGKDVLKMPAFLRRGDQVEVDREDEMEPLRYWMPPKQARLGPTRAEKDSAALAVRKHVRAGADTKGKIRRAQEWAAERLMCAGIRLAIRAKWIARDGRRYRSR